MIIFHINAVHMRAIEGNPPRWTRHAVKAFLPLVTENESALINPVNKPVTTP